MGTLPSGSVKVAPDGTGTDLAVHTAGGITAQAVFLLNSNGELLGTQDHYRLIIPSQAVGANKVWGDIFNATGSGKTMIPLRAIMYPDLDTAVTGTLGIEVFVTRTTAVGTGGTAANNEGTSLTAPSIAKFKPGSPNLPAGITARSAPTGGATAGAVLGSAAFFTEETNAGTAVAASQGVSLMDEDGPDFEVPENSGLRFVQGSVASVGNAVIVFDFALI